MNAAKLFAKLSTRAADYSFMPFSESTSTVNIALHTKGMYDKAYLAARFVWSKDLSVSNTLSTYITNASKSVAQKEKWKCNGVELSERIKSLVQLAMIEHYSPNIFRTQKSRYQFCNIDERQWFRTWKKRYEVPYTVINSYLDIAKGSMHE